MSDTQPGFEDLAHAFLDGAASDDDVARLESLLETDSVARESFLRLADLHACLAVSEHLWAEPTGLTAVDRQPPEPARPSSSAVARQLPAAVAGVLVGLLCASLTFGYVMPRLRSRVVLVDEGFETGPPPLTKGTPVGPGVWSGDFSRVVGADQGVSPHHGRRMLRLLRADYEGKPKRIGYIAELWHMVDLRQHIGEVGGGRVTARVTAFHNTAAVPGQEAYATAATLYALDAKTAEKLDPNDVPSYVDTSLAMSQKAGSSLDRDPQTWQAEHCELNLPAGTEFLLVRVGVAHATSAQQRVDFPGHYVDDLQVTLETRGHASP